MDGNLRGRKIIWGNAMELWVDLYRMESVVIGEVSLVFVYFEYFCGTECCV